MEALFSLPYYRDLAICVMFYDVSHGPLRMCRRDARNVTKVGNSYKKKLVHNPLETYFILMFLLRPFIALFALVMFVTAIVGLPVTIHYCGGEAVATKCPPDECCSEQLPDDASQEEPCCTDEVSVASIESQVVVTQITQIGPVLWVVRVIQALHITTQGPGHAVASSPHAEHPYPPPDLSELCILRV